MPQPRRHILAFLAFALAAIAQADPLSFVRDLPDTNPYVPALTQYLNLPEEEKAAIANWASPPPDAEPVQLSIDQLALARSITGALITASKAASTTDDIWPIRPNPDDPDNPAAIIIPEVGVTRALARIATAVAANSSPAESIEIYAATARLARSQRNASTLIHQLTGIVIEGMATQAAAARLLDYSPADLASLAAEWPATNEIPSLERALDAERNIFFIPLIQNTVLPGVKAMLAADTRSASSETNDDDELINDAELQARIAHLRLSGLVDDGTEKFISLENTSTGEFFTVRQGRIEQTIELTGFDLPNRRALIRIAGRDAVINLQTKEISAQVSAAKRLEAFLEMMSFSDPTHPKGAVAQAWLDRIRQHPQGPDGYFADLLVRYDALSLAQIKSAQTAKMPTQSLSLSDEDFILKLLIPSLARVARNLNTGDTSVRMLQAAIHHRLGQLNHSMDPFASLDPWAETEMTPFALESTPDGGFLLRSAYELKPDEPVTYKFGTPDAGHVRKK